jgi:hypothetical protein
LVATDPSRTHAPHFRGLRATQPCLTLCGTLTGPGPISAFRASYLGVSGSVQRTTRQAKPLSAAGEEATREPSLSARLAAVSNERNLLTFVIGSQGLETQLPIICGDGRRPGGEARPLT